MILLKFWSKWPYFQGRDCKNLKPTRKNQAWWFCCFEWMTWLVKTNFFNFQGDSLVWKADWKSLNWKAVRIDERLFIRQHRQYGRFKKGRKKPKQRFTITFFVSPTGKKRRIKCWLYDQSLLVFQEHKGCSKTRNCSLFCKFQITDNLRRFWVILWGLNRKLIFQK